MSSSALLAELRALRQDLAELSLRVAVLEEARDQQVENGVNQVVVNYNVAGSTSNPPAAPVSGPETAAAAEQTPVVSSGLQRPSGNHRVGAAYYSDSERRAIAVAAGHFIRRSLAGDHRGTSGREQLRLQSRVYILFRDFAGRTYNPVAVYDSLAALNVLVRPSGELGDSVFIGFPTRWEAKLCAETAGVAWPRDD